MELSNLEMSEKSIDVQENNKDFQENDMLLAEVCRQVNPLSFCACTHFVQRIYITPHRTSAEERALRPSLASCLVHARKEFWVILPSVEPWPPSTTSKISNPLGFLPLQTRQNCLGWSWNQSIKRPERRLHSWASNLATQKVWRLSRHETTSHLCFLSETCLYPQSSLMMPDWGLLQRKMARKKHL